MLAVLLLTGCDLQARVDGATREYALSPHFIGWFTVAMLLLSAGAFGVSRMLWKEEGSGKEPDGEHIGAALGYFIVGLVPLLFVGLILVASGDRYVVTAEGYEWRYAHSGGKVWFADVERVEDVSHVHSGGESFRFHLRDGTSIEVARPRPVVAEEVLGELARREIPVAAIRDESWEDFLAYLRFACIVLPVVFATLGIVYGLGHRIARRRRALRARRGHN